MVRSSPIVVGLAVLLGAGAVHGLWTERWRRSAELEEAGGRLRALPDEVGGWKGQLAEQPAEELAAAGATAHWGRFFTDPAGGEAVQVLLLCGPPGRMAVHRPEDCYRTAGYALAAAPEHCRLRPAGGAAAELWTGLFTKEEAAGPVQLRIFWTWGAGGAWRAPAAPRLAFARHKALYKLYVIRELHGPEGPLGDDPCVALLGRLLPELDKSLFPPLSPP
jgi:hypothetical protein